ncbi:MAG: Transcriptional repressor NrdR [candidate division WS6 bacterium GW2011_GWC1_36_11]|uniref:Transcriptional repressor NrdR n=3 Tax=Candidatus Dojkabacteria TaxID=74243 RepID=A0A0G0GJQ8_9BACT|nr:MAG: Transcriptional repressor NrdR [candidate division WS6 bacterium GW2011_GWC1_36_11]KKQ11025.1 MAG: Transcriptional repressor NrdR [candidate division WS6 bacterium GW2011_GWC2_36_7]KKQ18012.1 MAG: Transcriptional repressor NrdR [candidate division WS6 bacterium GW2011_GWF1_36_8]HAM37241.1 transcriptional regulator NrdR [Patescibacteria group bacterium]HAM96864.1 transcriptional regulator NrdR [Patescibacteria group bacterium]
MRCPFCACDTTKVVDKRDNREDSSTRRRRQCLRCGKRFTTYERIEKMDVSIMKKDGSLETFDINKIIKGIKKAINENTVSTREVEDFAEQVERSAINSEEPMSSKEIGKMILDWLKTKDQLSYIRFASVYKEFKDLDDIKEEINKLEKF